MSQYAFIRVTGNFAWVWFSGFFLWLNINMQILAMKQELKNIEEQLEALEQMKQRQ